MAAIEIRDLQWGYAKGGQRIEVLSGINLDISSGEVVALLGQSGSGKSSLLNLMAGIEPLQGGDIVVNGQSLAAMGEQQRSLFRRSHVGFVYQFFNLIPTLTAAENIELVLELNGETRQSAVERAQQQLKDLGLEDKTQVFPDVLSGGEQQRVAIGRALVHRPSLILADEPTGNLDANSGRIVLQRLLQQTREQQTCLIIVTHSQAVAGQADRILTLTEGQLQESQGELAW